LDEGLWKVLIKRAFTRDNSISQINEVSVVDRDNKFAKVSQGIIRINNSHNSPTGMRPKIRVVDDVGYIDIWLNNMYIPEEEFDATFETLYGLWEKELVETIEVLAPQKLEYTFVRMHPDDLRQLLLGCELEPSGGF